MALVQKILKNIMPAKMAKAMEEESRKWMMRCPDGHETSVWDAGGIRSGAKGQKTTLYKCPTCKKARKMTVYKKE